MLGVEARRCSSDHDPNLDRRSDVFFAIFYLVEKKVKCFIFWHEWSIYLEADVLLKRT
jgi:hypothetical protein